MKKILSIILTLVMLTSVCAVSFVSADAALPPLYMGDLNKDGLVDILDATLIQKIIAKIHESNSAYEYIGDVDKDSRLSIRDASLIQKWLVGLVQSNVIDQIVIIDAHTDNFYANYSDGMAMAGVPVTFTIDVTSYVDIISYDLYVNDVVVDTSTTENSFEYTFDKPGDYTVSIVASTPFLSTEGYVFDYTVVEPYDLQSPVIKGFYFTDRYYESLFYSTSGMKANVEVIGGTAPYSYKFVFTRPETLKDGAKTIEIVQDYSDKNYFTLPKIEYDDVRANDYDGEETPLNCQLKIYVKDANGVEITETKPITYMTLIIPA